MEDRSPEQDNLIRDELTREGTILLRYLTRSEAAGDLVGRYVAANQILFPTPERNSDHHLMRCILKHPGFLPYIDAYTGLFNARSIVRKKILCMLSIIETTPEFAEAFRPISFSKIQFIAHLISTGLSAAVKCLIGVCLVPFLNHTK